MYTEVKEKVISKSTMRLIRDMQDKVETYQPSYCGDHIIDRIYCMREEPVYCIYLIRENGTELYDLTWKYDKKDTWNSHLDSIKSCLKCWLESGIKGIYTYSYGYCHTIEETSSGDNLPKDRIDRAHNELNLLIESFRRV